MDRIDIVIDVARPDPSRLLDGLSAQPSSELRMRVLEGQAFRQSRATVLTASLSGAELLTACELGASERHFLEVAARNQHLSGRGITRLLRVARTLADLDQRASVSIDDLSEALGYRARGGR
jgi:magnesium chelatase family protein